MRDYSLQTPQKDPSAAKLRSKSTSVANKKPPKVTPKSLSSAFSEDSLTYFIDSPSITDISDDNLLDESFEEVLVSPTPASTTAANVVSTETASSSSVITCDEPKDGASSSTTEFKTGQEITELLSSVDVEVVLKHLRDARLQVSKTKNGDSYSKELLNILLNAFAEELCQSPAEKKWFNVIMSNNGYVELICLLLWTILVLAVLFSSSRSKIFYPGGLIPT